MVRLLQKGALVASALLAGSCAVLVPHTLMTPTVRAKGETEIDLSGGLHGTSLQAAYAPGRSTILLASAHRWVRDRRWSYGGEAGAGYQWIRPNGGSWSVYGGGGYGAGYSYNNFCPDLCSNTPTAERARYAYVFVQPTYTLVRNEYTNLGLAIRLQPLRLNSWQYFGTRYSTDSLGNSMEEHYPINRAGQWLVLLQPGLNMRRRLGRRLNLTSGISAFLPLRSRTSSTPSVLGLAASVGIQLVLGR
ncbi:hypothetical protein [Hymenobacter sp. APR13]|uniref:hypothetical protein n=1 Tax=Hymenobacter sp. APR13 TaxID=1356852 RepID=UPI0012E08C3E|nr:hypothetical protein [Hymenobacter sp. APR13]